MRAPWAFGVKELGSWAVHGCMGDGASRRDRRMTTERWKRACGAGVMCYIFVLVVVVS